jgi:hypothetical protein
MQYYTYAYLREDGTPYYIGKGKNRRIYKKSNKGGINLPKDRSRIIFLKKNLTEEEAFRHEIYMIAVFGRKDLGTGILHNRTNGGEGSSGMLISEENKIKLSVSNKKNKHWMKGNKTAFTEKCPGPGWKRGRNINKEKTWWFNGNDYIFSKDCPEDGEWEMCGNTKGLKWWNNGIKNLRAKECPGEGWKPGAIGNRGQKGNRCWNNGVKTVRAFDCPGPEWKPGMLSTRSK